MVSAQEWLDKNYPVTRTCLRKDSWGNSHRDYGKTRKEITKLNISSQNLTGELDLTTFPHLETLACEHNQLTQLSLPRTNRIREIWAANNLLTTINWTALNPDTLTTLSLSNNNLAPTELTVFSPLVNLEKLWINNEEKKIKAGTYNRFEGSLAPLSALTKLKRLSIINTELVIDPAYLPSSLAGFDYSLGELTSAQIKAITQRKIELAYSNKRVKSLKLSYQELAGQLDLREYVNLEALNCSHNQLTNLAITALPLSLTDLDLSYNESLNNHLSEFSQLVNLKRLILANTKIKGSLESLKQLTKLEVLNIGNTDINAGVEYLPVSIYRVDYDTKLRPNCQLKAIEGELKEFKNDYQTFIEKKIKQNKQERAAIIKSFDQKEEFLCGRLKDYKPHLGELLGQGGFAIVYQGLWKGNLVAVKKSLYNFNLNPAFQKEIDDIKKEIELLKQLRNKYIIQYYDFYQEGSDFMIIIELAEQGSLTDYIKNHAGKEYDWKTNFNFIKHTTLGLSYLHHSNIIHRDLKSMNVLITKENVAKLADFGLSQVINNLSSLKTTSKNQIGTVAWMAPEIFLHNKPHTFASDIYSLGMTIWELVAKEVPFKDKAIYEIIRIHYQNEKEEIPVETPSVLKEIIVGCWQDNPQQRIKLKEIEQKITTELNKLEAQVQIPPK